MATQAPKVGGLRWRRRIFWGLALASLAFIGIGFMAGSGAADIVQSTPITTETSGGLDVETATELRDLGADIGGGIATAVFCIIGAPLFILFSLLAWRNGAGLRTARQHHELLMATQARNQAPPAGGEA